MEANPEIPAPAPTPEQETPTVPETSLTVEVDPETVPAVPDAHPNAETAPAEPATADAAQDGPPKPRGPIWDPKRPGCSSTGSWILGVNNTRPVKDVFAEFSKLEGELSDEVAKATLAEFLFHNPAFLMEIIGGIKMLPMQEMIVKGWSRNDYNLGVWGRGVSKSFTVSLFVLFWAIFNPGCRIVVASFTFKQSRMILDQCEKFINDKEAPLLRACFPDGVRRGTDEWTLKVPNGATIRCLPLGDGTGIRGVRADLLVVDEFAFLPETVIGEILRPFLASKNKIKEQLTIREKEDELIKAGVMTEEQRTIIDDRKKVIFLSSASYSFEHLAKRFKDWTGKLLLDPKLNAADYNEFKAAGRSYFVSRISYEAAPPQILDMDEINQAKKEMSEPIFQKEYGARFISDSDGFFRASWMEACSYKDGESPCLELSGDPKAEYVLGIDQSLSGSETSDHFAMCLMRIVTRETDKRRIGMVVHSYAVAGGRLQDHALYLYYLLTNFNIVYIGLDASQGDEVEFVNTCNMSPLFKEKGLQLLAIDADFKKDYTPDLPTEIRKGYNREAGKIVHKQPFSSGWQRVANEYLQACFNHKNMRFAAKIAANPAVAGTVIAAGMPPVTAHEEFKDMTVTEFIAHQDFLVDLTRKECAMIQVKATDLGTMSWGLPQNLRRTTGVSRVRKDNYSALLIANWSVRMYVESQSAHVQTGPQEFEYSWVN